MRLLFVASAIGGAFLWAQPASAQSQGGYERCYRERRAMGYSHAQASRYCARYPRAGKKQQ